MCGRAEQLPLTEGQSDRHRYLKEDQKGLKIQGKEIVVSLLWSFGTLRWATELQTTKPEVITGAEMARTTHIQNNYIERANAQSAADPVYWVGMVWSASYALARPRAEATRPDERPGQG